jgi:hypothetical protein
MYLWRLQFYARLFSVACSHLIIWAASGCPRHIDRAIRSRLLQDSFLMSATDRMICFIFWCSLEMKWTGKRNWASALISLTSVSKLRLTVNRRFSIKKIAYPSGQSHCTIVYKVTESINVGINVELITSALSQCWNRQPIAIRQNGTSSVDVERGSDEMGTQHWTNFFSAAAHTLRFIQVYDITY